MNYALEMQYERKTRELGEIARALGAREKDRYSLVAALDAARYQKPDTAPRERDYSEALQAAHGLQRTAPHEFYISTRGLAAILGDGILRRDLNTASASAGGALVASRLGDDFADALRPVSRAFRLGAMAVPLTGGPLTMPRIGTASAVTWLGSETAAATETQPVVGQIALAPKTAASYTECSRQLALQSGQVGERIIAWDLLQAVGTALDAAVFAGIGAGGQPLGLVNTPGVTAISGTTLNRAGLLELQRRVAVANGIVDPSTIGYVAPPATAETLAGRAVVAGSDVSAWQGNLAEGTAAGAVAVTTTSMPTATVAFGDWSQALVASWGVLKVEVNPYANFPAGIIAYRILIDCDVGFRQLGSFCLATAVT